ncbi:MAG: hypothetical protein JO250_04180 [Armatimonadetes bacterium]|nr:hypothetical protein [Armatimonadota bacterium]
MTRWRWRQETEPGTPDGNMAADAALLAEVRDGASPIVRVYAWDRPCVSIGRLQDEAVVRTAYPDLPLVRRPTGGRAVRHGDDLTISVAARLGDLPAPGGSGVSATYRLIAGGVMDALCALGVPAEFGAADGRSSSGVDCFATACRCDIVDRRTGRKLVGCAQRRECDALLQQMSLPLVNIPNPAAFPALIRRYLAARTSVSAWMDVQDARVIGKGGP